MIITTPSLDGVLKEEIAMEATKRTGRDKIPKLKVNYLGMYAKSWNSQRFHICAISIIAIQTDY